jgi:hypothetical protein
MMSNCPHCGNHGMRNGEYCNCVFGTQKAIHDMAKSTNDVGAEIGHQWKSVLTAVESM